MDQVEKNQTEATLSNNSNVYNKTDIKPNIISNSSIIHNGTASGDNTKKSSNESQIYPNLSTQSKVYLVDDIKVPEIINFNAAESAFFNKNVSLNNIRELDYDQRNNHHDRDHSKLHIKTDMPEYIDYSDSSLRKAGNEGFSTNEMNENNLIVTKMWLVLVTALVFSSVLIFMYKARRRANGREIEIRDAVRRRASFEDSGV